MKGDFVSDIKDNQPVNGLFLVKSATLSETRNGKPFLSLVVMDNSGEITSRVWDNAEAIQPLCRPGAVIRLNALAQSYKGALQLKINTLEGGEPPDGDMSHFLPATSGDIPEMAAALQKLGKSIPDQAYRELVGSFFADRRIFAMIKEAPAAKGMHHAYYGGLLEHTLGVARLADAVAGLYPTIDRSLLLAGAILHDIGKLSEFDFADYPIDYSEKGRLVGHMVLGVEMIQEQAQRIPALSEEKITRLKHLILSHHGRHEFGAPTLPMMLEAFVLHFLDDLDAKVNYITGLAGRLAEDEYQWTDYQRNLERFLLVRGAPGDRESAEPENPEIDPRQRSLWG
ncbi:MAG: 3'-5' exoribonuclease YhaM family protein [Proteobacteria bacterium]|nr:3'-5' exoribonuclease YhaM family protein [Pseudomonadota bacterium]MBU1686288.1 3'-5' exoribonuclease YhaM family protein [Pseudomonadota bacterium]